MPSTLRTGCGQADVEVIATDEDRDLAGPHRRRSADDWGVNEATSGRGDVGGEHAQDAGAGRTHLDEQLFTTLADRAAALAEALITILVMSSIGFIPPLVMFLVILVAIGALGLARPRPRVFLAGGIVLVAFVGLNFPFAIDGLMHPVGSGHAWTDIIAIVAGIAGAIAGFAAFRELRRGAPLVGALRSPIGEALAILVVGALIGTTYVSVVVSAPWPARPVSAWTTASRRHRPRLPSSWMPRARRSPRSRSSCAPARARSMSSTSTATRTRSYRPQPQPPVVPRAGSLHDRCRAEPRSSGNVHVLVRDPRPSLDHGGDAGGERVMTTRTETVDALNSDDEAPSGRGSWRVTLRALP